MTLAELIEKIECETPSCGDYGVVAFREPAPDEESASREIQAVLAVRVHDDCDEVLIRVADPKDEETPETPPLTVNALLNILTALGKVRAGFAVECTSADEGEKWSLHFPICGTGVNSRDRLFALVM